MCSARPRCSWCRAGETPSWLPALPTLSPRCPRGTHWGRLGGDHRGSPLPHSGDFERLMSCPRSRGLLGQRRSKGQAPSLPVQSLPNSFTVVDTARAHGKLMSALAGSPLRQCLLGVTRKHRNEHSISSEMPVRLSETWGWHSPCPKSPGKAKAKHIVRSDRRRGKALAKFTLDLLPRSGSWRTSASSQSCDKPGCVQPATGMPVNNHGPFMALGNPVLGLLDLPHAMGWGVLLDSGAGVTPGLILAPILL